MGNTELILMIPGMNPRQMKQAMRRMGIQQQDIDATEVIIRTADGNEIVISPPSVAKVNMMGQDTYQISGPEMVRAIETAAEITAEDVQTVMDQTGVNEEKAKAAIEEADGDLAQAILNLSE